MPTMSLSGRLRPSFRVLYAAALALGLGSAAHSLEVDTTATLAAPSAEVPTPSMARSSEEITSAASSRSSDYQTLNFTTPTLVASWNGGSLDTEQLSATLALRRPHSAQNLEPRDYGTLPADRWRRIIRDIVYELVVYEIANREGITSQTTGIREQMEETREAILNNIYFEKEIEKRAPAVEERFAREYYDRNRSTQFTRPERILVSSLHIPLLDEVTVKQGETLEQVAVRVSGDGERRWDFLRGEPPYAPRLPQGEARAVIGAVEARPGETLLAPVPKEEAQRRLALAQQLRQQLLAGDSITSITAAVTSPKVLLAMDGGNYEPEWQQLPPGVPEAIKALETTSTRVTDPLQNPLGIDLYRLEARLTTFTIEFENVREQILTGLRDNENYRRRLSETLRAELFDDIQSTHSLQVNTAALERETYGGNDPLTGSTWIVRAGKIVYTLDEFLKDLNAAQRSWFQLTPLDRIELAKAAPKVIREMIRLESERLNLDDFPEYAVAMESRSIQLVSSEWLKRQAAKKEQTTESVLIEFYQANIERYTSSSMVTVREITRRFDPSLPPAERTQAIEQIKAQLGELREEAVKSQADFERVARRSSASISTRSRGGLVGTVPIGYRGPVVEQQLARLKPGEVTEPFVVGAEVVLLRLDNYVGAVPQPYEKVLPLVLRDYLREVPRKKLDEERDRLLKEAGYQLHF